MKQLKILIIEFTKGKQHGIGYRSCTCIEKIAIYRIEKSEERDRIASLPLHIFLN